MKLVYQETQTEVKEGDIVEIQGCPAKVTFFRPPHKPSSEGKVNIQFTDPCGVSAEYYVGVIGAEWIEREDRGLMNPAAQLTEAEVADECAKLAGKNIKVKPRVHNEWFRTVSLGGRKSCPGCKAKLEPGESIWSWGEYVRVKWNTVMHFCKLCYRDRVFTPLKEHVGACGCQVELVRYRGDRLPNWLSLNPPSE